MWVLVSQNKPISAQRSETLRVEWFAVARETSEDVGAPHCTSEGRRTISETYDEVGATKQRASHGHELTLALGEVGAAGRDFGRECDLETGRVEAGRTTAGAVVGSILSRNRHKTRVCRCRLVEHRGRGTTLGAATHAACGCSVSNEVDALESIEKVGIGVFAKGVKVVAHSTREKHGVLGNVRDTRTQVVDTDRSDINTVDKELAGSWVGEAKQTDELARWGIARLTS